MDWSTADSCDQASIAEATGLLKVSEPAIDLAVCLAIISALKNKKMPNDLVAFGEVGLGGEIRPISQMKKRLIECQNLGYKKAIVPVSKEIKDLKKIDIIQVNNIEEAIRVME